jgi:hypothetical protein
MALGKTFQEGLFQGSVVWGAYAVGEIANTSLRPLLVGYRDIVPGVVWEFTALLLGIYLIAGGLLTGLASAVARGWRADSAAERTGSIATLTLTGR